MTRPDRYEIVDTIASGDFATVFRGVDHELHRDVAIKQIHQQYLADPRQLDRYWQEAHLLASLQHPHIMTIYDIVRERGWLILELMQGSMTQLLGGRAIDLKDLRLTLNYALQALQTMHRNGILHGDIKPSNLLVDRNSRIKLGDFGIARRLAGEGSVTKGTTKYIAPEVVSDQFGAVGPHSDIYSLGFTAYELMCGEHFDSLFPGLNMYGRDKQIAWMMWHSAPDRRLPEVARVLNGVPADLAFIIQRMTEKDPARRYRSTDEVLADLKLEGQVPTAGPTPEETAAAEAQSRAARRKRFTVVAAATCSIVLSLGMLFFFPATDPDANKPKKKPSSIPAAGEIVEVVAENNRLFVKPEKGETRPVPVREGIDRVYLNGQQVKMTDLDRRDRVRIAESSINGKKSLVIEATREAAQEASGVVTAIDFGSALLDIAQTEPEPKDIQFLVSSQPLIEINGQTAHDDRPYQLSDLKKDDRVRVRYKTRDDQRLEIAVVRALRTLVGKGRLVEIKDKQIKIQLGESPSEGGAELVVTVAPDCVIQLNGQSTEAGSPITLARLRPRDSVTIEYDTVAHRIEALRAVEFAGVLRSRDVADRTVTIESANGQSESFQVTNNTQIGVLGTQVRVSLASLREGDTVVVRRRSPDPEIREAGLITITPQYDPRNWALVIEQSAYGREVIPELPFVSQDAEALYTSLRFQYRVPEKQCLRERNPGRERMQAILGDFVRLVPADTQILVCFLGRGFVDEKQMAYLVPHDFDVARPAETGVPLRWLLDALDQCAASEKLLILDTSRESEKAVPASFASPKKLVEAARPRRNRPISPTVAVLAGNTADEASRVLSEQSRSVFGLSLSEAFGAGDENGDQRLGAEELAKYVTAESAKLLESKGATQPPLLILPDPTPPRLSDAARESVLKLLDRLTRPMPDVPLIEYDAADNLCVNQPDADLAYILLLLKNDKSPPALETAEKIMVEQATAYPAFEVAAWIHGRRGNLKRSVAILEQIFPRLPKAPDAAERAYELHVATLAGRLAAFAMSSAPSDQLLKRSDLASLERVLNQRGPETYAAFIDGGRALRQSMSDLATKISEETIPDEKKRLELLRSNFNYHVPFDYETVRKFLVERVEK